MPLSGNLPGVNSPCTRHACPLTQVHERHLNTDLLLALARALALQRPELRVVVMSATINVAAYSDYFGAAPVIMVGQLPGPLRRIRVLVSATKVGLVHAHQHSLTSPTALPPRTTGKGARGSGLNVGETRAVSLGGAAVMRAGNGGLKTGMLAAAVAWCVSDTDACEHAGGQVPGRLHPISVSYLASGKGAQQQQQQRRSNEQRRALAAKGGRRQALERIDPTPYLRHTRLALSATPAHAAAVAAS